MKHSAVGLAILMIGVFPAAVMAATVAPFGAWKSPISPAMAASEGVGVGDVAVDGANVYWVESLPDEDGRNAVMMANGTGVQPVLPKNFSALNMVHEYGGGNLVAGGGVIHFPNAADQRLYVKAPGQRAKAITPEGPWRYADCTEDKPRRRLVCVREDHRVAGDVKNTLVAISSVGDGDVKILFEGADFVAAPRVDAAGGRIAWVSWNHPNMPWEATTLWVADIRADGALENQREVATGHSSVEPQWAADGRLYFVSDRSGWWNIYRFDGKKTTPLSPMAAEFSAPAWQFNASSYALLTDDRLVAAVTRNAITGLVEIDIGTGKSKAIDTPFVGIRSLRRYDDHHVVFVGDRVDRPPCLVKLDIATGKFSLLHVSRKMKVANGYISRAQEITFPVASGEISHAFYYPPRNSDYAGPEGRRPPLIVMAHGGPTANATPALSLAIQYWTSRGFAFLDVNYRGSSGYGRDYRNKLKGQWGVVDIQDVIKGAEYVAGKGLADPKRLIVRGGSAGGYVVLASLAFHNVFATGASYYGIGDLAALAKDTHKFESRYMESLVGPYPARADLYTARSPVKHIDGFKTPLILFQGLDDQVVPPTQSAAIANALRQKHIEVEYYTYPGEGHGFRKAENIIDSLNRELAFYRRILHLD